MSSIQKLDDLVPTPKWENRKQLCEEVKNTCSCIDGRVSFSVNDFDSADEEIWIDKELVFEVTENLVSNASRYADKLIQVDILCEKDFLSVSVLDDGEGFSGKILSKVGRPFLREDNAEDKNHFGLGIYISKLICEKCGGSLTIENREGAFAKAVFNFSPDEQ